MVEPGGRIHLDKTGSVYKIIRLSLSLFRVPHKEKTLATSPPCGRACSSHSVAVSCDASKPIGMYLSLSSMRSSQFLTYHFSVFPSFDFNPNFNSVKLSLIFCTPMMCFIYMQFRASKF